jgi:hypothetical protein
MKDIKTCPHEGLYSETPAPFRPSTTPGPKPKKNGFIPVPGRPDIETDYCFDCEMWIYEDTQFNSTDQIISYVDDGEEPEEFQWIVEVIFCKTDGYWNVYHAKLPYDGPTNEEIILDPPEYLVNNASARALREFDARGDMKQVDIHFRAVKIAYLEQK